MHPWSARIGRLGIWHATDALPAGELARLAARVEALGYGALWMPEVLGRDPFATAGWLAARTDRLVLATGIASIHHRLPGVTRQAQLGLAELTGNRFLLGLGVSHAPIVTGVRGQPYDRPRSRMAAYLEAMASAPYAGPRPDDEPPTVIAALGPRMLELAAAATDGAHPYLTTPEHTARARRTLGPDRLLCPEQKVVLATDPEVARRTARAALAGYLGLPNYVNSWKRLGFTDDDTADGGSDRLVDALVAWGDADAVRARIDEHLDAGADHVCLQILAPDAPMGAVDSDALEALAPA